MCTYGQALPAPADVQSAVNQTVRVTGTPAIAGNTYRWYRGASGDTTNPVTNWQAANYIDVTLSSTAQFWYQLQNGTCVSSSGTGTVNVCIPAFTAQPQSVTIQPSTSTTLTAAANTSGVTYQWYTGTSGTTSSPISGATGASLTVSPASTTNYWVRATGSCGRTADSATATVTVCAAPAITRQPYDPPAVNYGYGATTDVIATGTNLMYQWYQGETGDTHAPLSGKTSSSLTLAIFSSTRVWVRITGLCGSIDSRAAWLSTYPLLNGVTQSTTRLGAGSMATVSISASGTSLHYAWRLNGNSVGSDSPTVIVQIDSDNSAVTCDVSSGTATSHSDPVYFSVCSGPYIYGITTYPQPNGCKTLSASIDEPQWVQSIDWYQGARGDTSHPVSMPVCPTSATTYWCRVTKWDDATQSSCYGDSQTVTLP
jgi:hypothetical protein